MYMLAALTDYKLEGVRGTWCGSRGVRGDLGGIKMRWIHVWTCHRINILKREIFIPVSDRQ